MLEEKGMVGQIYNSHIYRHIHKCLLLQLNIYTIIILHYENVISYYTYKLNFKTTLLEEYINFVESTKKQTKYYKTNTILFVVILCLFLFFVLFKYI